MWLGTFGTRGHDDIVPGRGGYTPESGVFDRFRESDAYDMAVSVYLEVKTFT